MSRTSEDVQPARFPAFDALREARAWDAETEAVVRRRLAPHGEARFFDETAEPTVRALACCLVGGGTAGANVPLFELLDERLALRPGDGYHYDNMPDDAEAWRASITALDAEARSVHGRPFHDLDAELQMALVDDVRTRKEPLGSLPPTRVFSLWLRYCCEAFYSHPAAWNEIGFPGPAYPRGYANLGLDRLEHFEVRDHHPADPVHYGDRIEAARRRHEELIDRGRRGGSGS